jgi:hypothetical protein
MLSTLSLQCIKLYEFNQEKNFSHFAVINSSGIISAPIIKTCGTADYRASISGRVQQQKVLTFRDDGIYHTLITVFMPSRNIWQP